MKKGGNALFKKGLVVAATIVALGIGATAISAEVDVATYSDLKTAITSAVTGDVINITSNVTAGSPVTTDEITFSAKNLTINGGSGAIVDMSGNYNGLVVGSSDTTLTISKVTFSNIKDVDGGLIKNSGIVRLSDVTIGDANSANTKAAIENTNKLYFVGGTSVINNAITGDDGTTVIAANASVTNNAKIDQNVRVELLGKLTTAATIKSLDNFAIVEGSSLDVTGNINNNVDAKITIDNAISANNAEINGEVKSGSLTIYNTLTNNGAGTIETGAIQVGHLNNYKTIKAASITAIKGTSVNGEATDGVVSNNTYSKLEVTGAVKADSLINNGEIEAGSLDIAGAITAYDNSIINVGNTGAIEAGSLFNVGSITAGSLDITGAIETHIGSQINVTNKVSASSIASNGTLNAGSLEVTNSLVNHGGKIDVEGSLTAGRLENLSTIKAGSLTVTANASSDGSIKNNITCSLIIDGAINASSIDNYGSVQADSLVISGDISNNTNSIINITKAISGNTLSSNGKIVADSIAITGAITAHKNSEIAVTGNVSAGSLSSDGNLNADSLTITNAIVNHGGKLDVEGAITAGSIANYSEIEGASLSATDVNNNIGSLKISGLTNATNLTNHSTFETDSLNLSGNLFNNIDGTLTIGNATITKGSADSSIFNRGVLNFVNGSSSIATSIVGSTGTLEIKNGATVEFGSGVSITQKEIIVTNGSLTMADDGAITGALTNKSTVTANATNMSGSINNDTTGILNLTGTLNQAISGAGTTKIKSSLALTSGASIAGTLDMNGGALTMAEDNAYTNISIGKLSNDGNITIDIDAANSGVSDKLTLGNGSAGELTITAINGFTQPVPTIDLVMKEYKIINKANDSDSVSTTLKLGTGLDSGNVTKTVESYLDNGKYQIYENTSFIGTSGIFLNDAKDSIKVGIISMTDSFVAANEYSGTTERVYNFSNTSKTFDSDLAATGSGTFTVNGKATDGTILNFDSHSGFDLSNATELTLNDITLSSGTTALQLNNASAVANLNNVTITGNTVAGIDNIVGTVNLNDVTIENAIINKGTFNFVGGNNNSISASISDTNGTLNIKDGAKVVFGSGASITQNEINVTNGYLTMADDGVITGTLSIDADGNVKMSADGITSAVVNKNNLELTGGDLSYAISGDNGKTIISGDVESSSSATIMQSVEVTEDGNFTVGASIGALTNNNVVTSNADFLTENVENNKTLNLTGGSLAKEISGATGTTYVGDSVSVKLVDGSAIKQELNMVSGGSVEVDSNTTNEIVISAITGDETDGYGNFTVTAGKVSLGNTHVNDLDNQGELSIIGTFIAENNVINGASNNSDAKLTITGTASIGNKLTNYGDMIVNGSLEAENVENTGTLTVNNYNDDTSSVTINGDVNVGEDFVNNGNSVTIAGDLEVEGDIINETSSSNDSTITVTGAISAATLTNDGKIKADTFEIYGEIENNDDAKIVAATDIYANSLTNNGIVKAGNLEIDNEIVNDVDGKIKVSGNITAGSVDNNNIIKGGSLDVLVAELDDGTITTGAIINNDDCKITIENAISAESISDNSGIISADTISITKDIINNDSGKILADGTISAGSLDNYNIVKAGSLTVSAASFSDGTSTTGLVTNNDDGKIVVSGKISASELDNYGTVKAGSIEIDTTITNNDNAKIVTEGAISATDLSNSGKVKGASLSVSGLIENDVDSVVNISGAIKSGSVSNNGKIKGSSLTVNNGAIVNYTDAIINIENTIQGISISNDGLVKAKSLLISNALVNDNNGTINIENKISADTLSNSNQLKAGSINVVRQLTNNNGAQITSGNVTANSIVNSTDASFDITGTTKVQTLVNEGTFDAEGNVNISQINNNGGSIYTLNSTFQTDKITSSSTGTVYMDKTIFNPQTLVENQTIYAKDSTINVAKNPYMLVNDSLNLDNTTVNIGNLTTEDLVLADLDMTNGSIINIKGSIVDYQEEKMGKIISNGIISADADSVINLNSIQLTNLSDKPVVDDVLRVNFVDSAIAQNVNYTGLKDALTPIWKYGVTYDYNTGDFVFAQGGRYNPVTEQVDYPTNPSDRYNPAVLASPVAAQVGGYMGMIDTYANTFNNLDMNMLRPLKARKAALEANMYALTENTSNTSLGYVRNDVNSSAVWFKPFGNYDSVRLHNGPKVHNFTYGSFIGGDSETIKLENGFYGVFSPYVSYVGSHQSYSGNSIWQNGGNLGISGSFYKGNFFTGLTIGAGASVAEASTMYGHESFPMLMAGIASKTGYNFEFKEGKYIIQPSMQLSYTFINTFDYTNAAGVRIDADPMHAIQIAPNFKFIMNTKNGWSPYLTIGMNWNIMDKTQFNAYVYELPQMSIRPYFQYGLGIQKTVRDRFTGVGQLVLRNGGRTGVGFSFGFRYAVGKDNSKVQKVKNAPTGKVVLKRIQRNKKL